MPVGVLTVPARDGKTGTKGESRSAKKQIENWLPTLPFEKDRQIILGVFHRRKNASIENAKLLIFHTKHGIQGEGRALLLERCQQLERAQK